MLLTLLKLKTALPPLKDVEKCLRSRVVCNLSCSYYQARYVNQTDWNLITWFKKHLRSSDPFGKHIRLGGVNPSLDNNNDVSLLQSISRSVVFLVTPEALWQREVKPTINTKVALKRRELRIKFQVGYIVVLQIWNWPINIEPVVLNDGAFMAQWIELIRWLYSNGDLL